MVSDKERVSLKVLHAIKANRGLKQAAPLSHVLLLQGAAGLWDLDGARSGFLAFAL